MQTTSAAEAAHDLHVRSTRSAHIAGLKGFGQEYCMHTELSSHDMNLWIVQGYRSHIMPKLPAKTKAANVSE